MSDYKKELKDILDYHNVVREKNKLPPLEWDTKLEEKAQKWADILYTKCNIQHPSDTSNILCPETNTRIPESECYLGKHGQNLYMGASSGSITDTSKYPFESVRSWYDECKIHKKKIVDGVPPNFHSVGHYTQVVWKDAKTLGCAKPSKNTCKSSFVHLGKKIPTNNIIWVCNYDTGNVVGQFPQNVLPKNKLHECPLKDLKTQR